MNHPTPVQPTTPSHVTPSSETDHRQPDKPASDDDDTAGIGRSYECTFCKRGFTNAQALGGHMNIHRKEKGKSKAKHKFTTGTNQDHHYSSSKSNEINYSNHIRYNSPPISPMTHHQDQQRTYCYMPGGEPVNYQVYLPSPNPNSQIGNFGLQPDWRPDGSVHHPNLSLRIGQSDPDEDQDGNGGEGNELDLELRLGHDP